MRPFLLALLLLMHALAHAGAGTWAAEQSSALLSTPLWLVAMCGFLGASFAVFGLDRLRGHAEYATYAATVASAMLLRLTGVSWLPLVGLGLGIGFSCAVRWWTRCAHPDIHTPTVHTGDVKAVRETPSTSRRVGASLAYAVLGVTALLIVVRPLHQTWGTSRAERDGDIPGLGQTLDNNYRIDHGVTIHAAADDVWPWLAQLGQDRAGFYSYDWLERAVGDAIHNADSLVPAWQTRGVGDLVRAAQPDYLGGRLGRDLGWRISYWDPPRAMTLDGWGTFLVRAMNDSTSRLTIHTRAPNQPSFAALVIAPLIFYLFEPAHFVMERGMLLGVKERAERLARAARGTQHQVAPFPRYQ